jgi:hypothetical protein
MMNLADVRVGQRVRWRTAYGTRTGQVYGIQRFTGEIIVDFFAAVHGGWMRQAIAAADLEAVEEEA